MPDVTTFYVASRDVTGAAKRKQQAAAAARRRRMRWAAAVTTGVVGLVALLVVVSLGHRSSGSGKSSTGRTEASSPAASAALAKLTSIPAASLASAAKGGGAVAPTPVSAPALTRDGKPEVLYVGAEYCPFCAAQRWAVVTALAKFGTFHGLGSSHSASEDAYPDTATFSFHGATYTSEVLAFSGVELRSNQLQNGNYAPLDTLDASQSQLFATYNAPPYTKSAGAIPFVDWGGKAVQAGASFDPQLLQGLTLQQIATAVADPGTDIGRQVQASAGTLVKLLCGLTGNRPVDTCSAFGAG